jgi:peptidoglycan L-alanyl-D-glutamate endopeptidase CwlK
MNLEAVIRAVQKELGVTDDGFAGPQTWGAIYNALTGKNARGLVQRAARADIDIKIISGLRTYAEQDALFAKGRTAPGPKVTNAKGGESNHNFGIAFDVGVFDGKNYLPSSPAYDVVGAIGVEIGLEWGGHWTSLVDKPHFQLRPDWAANLSARELLAELRERVQDGRPFYA